MTITTLGGQHELAAAGALAPRGEHLYWLDWLRFSAALLVVVCHSRGSNWVAWSDLAPASKTRLNAALFVVTRPGLEAVIIFFVLSGFLVGGRVLERWRNNNLNLQRYWIDRVSRIYAPLIPALVFTGLLGLVQGGDWSWKDFFGNILGVQGVFCGAFGGNAPLWSLSYEMWFYVLAGCFAGATLGRGYVRIVPWIVMAVGFSIFTKLNATYLICWMIGAAAYVCLGRQLPWSGTVVAILLISVGVMASQMTSDTRSVDVGFMRSWIPSRDVAMILLSLGLALLLVQISVLQPSNHLRTVEKTGTVLAGFSYTLYLVHYPWIQFVSRFSSGPFGRIDWHSEAWFGLKIITSLIVASLIYLPFEAQTARLRRALTKALS